MTVTMYDTQYPSIVPASAELVVAYPDGPAGNSFAEAQRIFGSRAHSITWTGVNADMADIEQWSSFRLPNLPNWIKAQHSRGIARPVIYAIYSGLGRNYAQVKSIVGNLAVSWWLSDWTGVPHSLPGADAVQYGAQAGPSSPIISNPSNAGGRTYDLSLVQPTFPFYPQPVSIWPLKVGSTGEYVLKLQKFLVNRKFASADSKVFAIDGNFGNATKAAVIKAQEAYKQRGITAGVCTQQLFSELEFHAPPA